MYIHIMCMCIYIYIYIYINTYLINIIIIIILITITITIVIVIKVIRTQRRPAAGRLLPILLFIVSIITGSIIVYYIYIYTHRPQASTS